MTNILVGPLKPIKNRPSWHLFQIYCKEKLDVGECLRIDGHYHTSKEKVNAVGMVTDNVAGEGIRYSFTTAEEMLMKQRRLDN
jgi:hypothetical protein